MARPERNTLPTYEPLPWSTEDTSHRPGGKVGEMQALLARQLAHQPPSEIAASQEERVIRLMSVAGGYIALLAGYAAVALLLLR